MWKKVRNVFRIIHLWLGVASSLVLTIVCLTGTLYVFQEEVVRWLNYDRFYSQADVMSTRIPLEELQQAVEQNAGGTPRFVSIPAQAGRKIIFNVMREGDGRRGSQFMADPWTGEVEEMGRLRGQEFFSTVLRLHRWLLLDTSVGRPIVGWSTIIMTILILSGIVIWVPRQVKNWKNGLKIKWNARAKRLNFDLHRALGIYAAIFILIMSLTGPFWSFSWYRSGFFKVLGVEAPVRGGQQGPQQQQQRQGGQREERNRGDDPTTLQLADFSLEHYMLMVDSVLAYKGDVRIGIPAPNDPIMHITKNKTGFFAPAGSDRVSINRVSGNVENIERFSDRKLNEQIAFSVKALHTGEILGMFSKILYFIAALIATSLPVTGVIIWAGKLRTKN